MASLKDYLISEAIEIKIEDHRIVDYKSRGLVLTNTFGKDIIDKEKSYILINGNIKPKEFASNFRISDIKNGTAVYLYNVKTFYEYVTKSEADLGLYAFLLTKREDIPEEEIIKVFGMLTWESDVKLIKK